MIRSRTGIDHGLVDSQIAGGVGSQVRQLIPTHLGGAGHDEREPAGIVHRLERPVARATVERRIATHAAEHTPTRLVHSTLVSEQHDLGTHPGITELIGQLTRVTDERRHEGLCLDHVVRRHRIREVVAVEREMVLVQIVLAVGEPEEDLTGGVRLGECSRGSLQGIDVVGV